MCSETADERDDLPLIEEVDIATERGSELLAAVYDETYVRQFPNPAEREPLSYFVERLRAKADDGADFFVLLALVDGRPVGASFFNFVRSERVGFLEFIVVDPTQQGRGTGGALLKATERRLHDASQAICGQPLSLIFAEMDDPFSAESDRTVFNPIDRAVVWSNWGYSLVDVDYVQPPLEVGGSFVECLCLIAKVPSATKNPPSLPRGDLLDAMRAIFETCFTDLDPASLESVMGRMGRTAAEGQVPLKALDSYVGRSRSKGLSIHAIESEDDPALTPLLRLYEQTFSSPDVAVESQSFRSLIRGTEPNGSIQDTPDSFYHLWAVHGDDVDAQRPDGLASFFTTPSCGFGGYVALGERLIGTGRYRQLLARREEQMMIDCPSIRGWFIECKGVTERDIFLHLGFRELAVEYRQPSLLGDTTSAVPLHLLYKSFGRMYEPRLSYEELATSLTDIFTVVYGLPKLEAETQVAAIVGDAAHASARFK
jgi:GNAT superfamily N-acetyltransferase